MGRQNPDRKIILGLTGSFGSGKTTVAGILKSFGADVIDADKVAHRIIKPGTALYKRIVAAFGEGIIKNNRTIDRSKLGRIVFNNKGALLKLNKIMHPGIIGVIKKDIASSRKKIVVLDAPLLVEAGLRKCLDKLIVVKASRENQIKRVRERSLLSKEEILKRIRAQIPLSDKVRMADFVIDNDGSMEELKKRIKQIRRRLWKN